MTLELKVPPLGESITEATVSKWLKEIGDSIELDEPIVEIETDKITLEVPSPSAGTLSEIKVFEGKDVSVGGVLGIIGDKKGMSIDLAKYNIRVNTVCPTFVVTPMTKKFLKSKKFKKEVLSNIPLGKFAELSDVASAAVFLASDAASMITGTSLLVDGGWTAK